MLLGDYACGLRIGLTGSSMLSRRKFLLRRLRDRHLRGMGRGPLDLWLLAVGGPMLLPNPVWQRTPVGGAVSRNLGPVWRRLAPQIVPAAVEGLLHPDAYRMRFGGNQWR